jgi:hypothetical protein
MMPSSPGARGLPDEEVLFRSDGGTLILTTHRVRLDARSLGRAELISILLDQVASCAQMHNRHPILAVLAAVAGLAGLMALPDQFGFLLLIIAVALTIAYFFVQPNVLVVRSPGHAIVVSVGGFGGMPTGRVREFIDQLEFAKDQRYWTNRNSSVERTEIATDGASY